MASRYGRNKRRAHRQEIERLEMEAQALQRRATMAERSYASAREEGMQHILRLRYLPQMVEDMARELSREYGPKVAEVAQQVMNSDRQSLRRIDLSASIDPQAFATVIRGVIPELRYNIAVSNF